MDAHLICHDDPVSDYGSDFTSDEVEILNSLLGQGPGSDTRSTLALQKKSCTNDESPRHTDTPHWLGRQIPLLSESILQTFASEYESDLPKQTLNHDSQNQNGRVRCETSMHWNQLTEGQRLVESVESRGARRPSDSPELKPTTDIRGPDLRSPLARFRTKPKKALSVTDVVSPSWCELQYWYTLTKHGRKRRTPAMRQGSAVHKILENQVHQTVTIDIKTREDAWGLRIWNIIQGLKILRETGMTRELEVWGIIDGEVVNGVIDELSYICPDKDLEEEAAARSSYDNSKKPVPTADQSTLTSFLQPESSQYLATGLLKSLRLMRKKTFQVYLTDVKTRGVKSVPKGASFRPTLMQLMLYQLMLSDMASNKIDADVLFRRYDLDVTANLSDSLIAQIGTLHETFHNAPSEPSQSQGMPDSRQESLSVLLEHNSLRLLWGLMMREFERTMPAGADSIGQVLKVEYRDQADGSIFGIKTFLYDRNVIQNYVNDEMSWWRGEREARGVNIEEAYKCRSCDFADGCEWRIAKIEEATTAHRTRSRSVV